MIETKEYMVDGQPYTVSIDKEEEFLKDHPRAVLVTEVPGKLEGSSTETTTELPTETSSSQNNQEENTESSSEDGSSESAETEEEPIQFQLSKEAIDNLKNIGLINSDNNLEVSKFTLPSTTTNGSGVGEYIVPGYSVEYDIDGNQTINSNSTPKEIQENLELFDSQLDLKMDPTMPMDNTYERGIGTINIPSEFQEKPPPELSEQEKKNIEKANKINQKNLRDLKVEEWNNTVEKYSYDFKSNFKEISVDGLFKEIGEQDKSNHFYFNRAGFSSNPEYFSPLEHVKPLDTDIKNEYFEIDGRGNLDENKQFQTQPSNNEPHQIVRYTTRYLSSTQQGYNESVGFAGYTSDGEYFEIEVVVDGPDSETAGGSRNPNPSISWKFGKDSVTRGVLYANEYTKKIDNDPNGEYDKAVQMYKELMYLYNTNEKAQNILKDATVRGNLEIYYNGEEEDMSRKHVVDIIDQYDEASMRKHESEYEELLTGPAYSIDNLNEEEAEFSYSDFETYNLQRNNELLQQFDKEFSIKANKIMESTREEQALVAEKYNEELLSNPSLVKIKEEYGKFLDEFWTTGDGHKLTEEYKKQWDSFSKTDEYKNLSDDELIKRYNDFLDQYEKDANALEALKGQPFIERYNNQYAYLVQQIPEVAEISNEAVAKLQYEYENGFKNYQLKNKNTYNQWDTNVLKTIDAELEAAGVFGTWMHSEEKDKIIDLMLDKYISIADEEGLLDNPADRQEYINEYYHYLYPKLAKQVNIETGKEQSTWFYNKGIAKDVLESLPKKDPNITPPATKVPFLAAVGYLFGDKKWKCDEWTPELLDLKEDIKEAGFEGDEEALEQETLKTWYHEYQPNINLARKHAEDVIDDPESMRDAPWSSGFLLGFTDKYAYEYVPIGGSLVNWSENRTVRKAVNKLESERTDYENLLIAMSDIRNNSKALKSEISSGYNIGQGFADAVPFVGEFIITGPAFRAAATTTKVALRSKLAARLGPTARVSKDGSKILFVKKGKSLAIAENSIDFLAMLNGTVSQTLAQGWRIAETYEDMITDEYIMAFSMTDNEIAKIDAITANSSRGKEMGLKEGYSGIEAAFRAGGVTWAEVFTERLGAYLPGVTKWMYTKSGISKLKKTPLKPLFDEYNWKRLTLGHLARKKGWTNSSELLDWMAKNGGYNGITGETFEEIVNIPLSNWADGRAPGILSGIANYDDEGNFTGWDYKGMKELLGTVASVSLAFSGGGIIYNKFRGRGAESYIVGDLKFDTEKKATEYLNKLIKEKKLTTDTKISVKNNFQAYDNFIKILEKQGLSKDQIEVNNPKTKLKHTATDIEILNAIKDPDKRKKLMEAEAQLAELKNQEPSADNKKKIAALTKEINNIKEPISNQIIRKKNSETYQKALTGIRKIMDQAKEKLKKLGKKGAQIIEAKNTADVEAKVLEKFGLKRNKSNMRLKKRGKIVATVDMEIGGKKIKKGQVVKEIIDKETGDKISIEALLQELSESHGAHIASSLLPEGQSDILIFNEDLSIDPKTANPNVASHEFFHFYLNKMIGDNAELRIAFGSAFESYVSKIDPKMIRDGKFRERLNAYWNKSLAERSEESMAIFLDAIANGSMNYNDGMFNRIGDMLRHLAYKLGIRLNLKDGRDVYRFLKEFQSSVERGSFSSGMLKELDGKLKVGGALKSMANSKEMADAVAKDKTIQQVMDYARSQGIKLSKANIENIIEEEGISESNQAIAAKNTEIYNKIVEIAEQRGISVDEVTKLTGVGDRIKGELILNNLNKAYDLAKTAYESGVRSLRDAGVPDYRSRAIEKSQWEGEFIFELGTFARTWKPSENPNFGAYIQTINPRTGQGLLENRYGVVYKRLKGQNPDAFSLPALEEKGFNPKDTSGGASAVTSSNVGIYIADKAGIDIEALRDVIFKSDLTELEKEKSYKKVKALVKGGSLIPALELVGKMFGIPVNKLTKKSDLNGAQRAAARKAISKLTKKGVNLIDILPEGQDSDGRSTEIVRTMFGRFYKGSGQRVEVGEGALKSLGQKERFDKMQVVPNEKFFELFGMDKNGNEVKTIVGKKTQFDGAITELVTQLATLATNQQIRQDREGFEEIGRGRSKIMFSKNNKPIAENLGAEFEMLNTKKSVDNFVDILVGQIIPFFEKEIGTGFVTKTIAITSSTIPNRELRKYAKARLEKEFEFKKNKDFARNKFDTKYVRKYQALGNDAFKNKTAELNKRNVKNFTSMWQAIFKLAQKDKQRNLVVPLLHWLHGSVNEGGHPHRIGAEFNFIDLSVKGKLYFEHALQNVAAYRLLLTAAYESKTGLQFNNTLEALKKNYKLIAISSIDNKKIDDSGLKNLMAVERVNGKFVEAPWNIFDNNWWQRYFNKYIAEINGGINAENIINIQNGKSAAEIFNINSNGSIRFSKPSPEIKLIEDIGSAFSNSINFSKKGIIRGMSTFDFDDTLGFTKSGVRATVPNPDGSPKPKRKVIFLAGGAGSGKGNVIKKLGLESMGFKIVNSDISLEWLKKNHGLPEDMNDLTKEQRSVLGKLGHQARQIAKRKMMKYQGNADGVVIDGTGGSVKSMQKLVDEFKSKGYDVSMLFVDTSLDVALARNKARKERSLLDVIVKRNHEAVQNNKSEFKDMFGKRFMEVNTDKLTQESPMPETLVNKINDFVSSYEKRRLDAAEFAEQGDAILEQGGEFDFSEFNDVVDGTPGPLLDKAKERAAKYGTKDMFVLTARPQASAKAIHGFLKSQGLDIPLGNITGLANSTGNAKAQWFLQKFAEGYNDMYFVDDALQNVEAVQKVLNQLDVKSNVVQAKIKFSKTASATFNEMLENRKGVDASKIFSAAEARKIGAQTNIVRFFKSLYIPPSAEDFKGLLYYFLNKGKQGELDMKFFVDNLLKPFAKGIRAWNTYKQNMVNDYKNLKKQFPKLKLNKKIPGTIWTNDTAIRTYLWTKAGFEIPGMNQETQDKLLKHINNNPDLKSFADALSLITKRKAGYIQPNNNWMMETIPTDLRTIVDSVGRKEFLEEWINNKNEIFSADNLNKIEALYGDNFRDALENILYRMENGTNRTYGKDKIVNRFTEWINGSVGAIMFFNIRSATLQTLSIVNFINWSDNNMFKAGKAFANQPQFWKDFVTLFNSDMLKQRRRGLQTDVSASELTKSFAENGYSPRTVINYLLQIGFTPTQAVDSFAIAFGGASLYRNRINTYIKQGMSEVDAANKAMLDFQEIAEETQQSSREDLVSQQQAGSLGRIILAFQNVTMQYGRLTKKALSDIVNNRGDMKTNVSKVLYYGFVQNVIFAALQSALAFLMWGDDEEEIASKTQRTFNSALDSFLRGTGLYGALASTLKNTIIQWNLQKDKEWGKERIEKIVLEVINLSPPIGSKVRKIVNAYYSDAWNEGVSEELGWRIENPKLQMAANLIEAGLNIPLARILNKANNLEEAITGNHATWQRIAMFMGWNRWDLGIEDEELEEAKDRAEIKNKEKRKEEKEKEKKEEEQRLKDEGYKSIRCSGVKSNGERCSIMSPPTKDKKFKCIHHMEFTDGMDRDNDGIKEYRCKGITKSGKRCKNKTENKNKRCYAHQ